MERTPANMASMKQAVTYFIFTVGGILVMVLSGCTPLC